MLVPNLPTQPTCKHKQGLLQQIGKKFAKKFNIAPNSPKFCWSMYNGRPHLGRGGCLNFLFDFYETARAYVWPAGKHVNMAYTCRPTAKDF